MKRPPRSTLQKVLDDADATVLDLVDNVLTKGVVIEGEVVLGLAGVDLVYLRLSALLCAADRVLPAHQARPVGRRPAS
ncbi:MAG: gas vesicle protein [Candidatus Rokuibacteriota bacterium]